MRKILTILLSFMTITIFAQTVEWQESFETDGDGTRYISSNSFNDGTSDHAQRTDGSDISNVTGPYSNFDGTFFWAAEDTDDDGGDGLDEKIITFNSINVTGFSGFVFKGLFGAGNESGPGSSAYDAADYIIFEYSIDGGAYEKGLEFRYLRDTDDFNEPLHQDTDFDGIGDGPQLLTTLSEFSFLLPHANSSIQFRIRFYMDSASEEIAFDNFRLSVDALPVELTSFSASVSNKSVQLSWNTATELNNYGFEIQRSIEEEMWKNVGFVSGNGTSNSPKDYSFVDNKLSNSSSYFYRLKQVDNDGSYEFSKTIEVVLGAPIAYKLDQNYPNPFNPATIISFTLPEDGFTRLTVFNSLGQEVKNMVNKNLEAGYHQFNFSAVNLTSGVYYYKLEAGSFVQINKMMLLK